MTHPFDKRQLRPIFAYDVSTLRDSEKSSIMTNRKSTTGFPTGYRWNAYVTPISPKSMLHSVSINIFKTAFKTYLFNCAYTPRHWQWSIGTSDSLFGDIRRRLNKSTWLTDWLTDWLIDWLIDWLTDRLIDYLCWASCILFVEQHATFMNYSVRTLGMWKVVNLRHAVTFLEIKKSLNTPVDLNYTVSQKTSTFLFFK